MISRRTFLTTAAAGSAVLLDPLRSREILAEISSYEGTPQEAARDEDYWFKVQQAYTVDRSIINLNSGGTSPAPQVVQAAMKRHLDYSNTCPVYAMWRILEPQREGVRTRLARDFDCDPEEIALTRNASEGLQICQFGMDLKPGDEVLTTLQDYPRMVNTYKQRQKREKIVLKQFPVPVPAESAEEIVRLFEQNITDRTRVILMCHMINLTGQILPVKQVVQMARKRGIPVIVDGAHTYAHFPFTQKDLDCDYYATSLHKWLCAPTGTGMLYVKKDRIPDLWPMMAAPEARVEDIRKYEEIGTHPAANYIAASEALTFHQGVGADRKAARLRYLRDRWAKRLMKHDRVKILTSFKPEFSCGIATVQVEGLEAPEIANHLFAAHRIIVVGINHPEVKGVRVSPNVFTTVEEVDRFAEAMEEILKKGIPGK